MPRLPPLNALKAFEAAARLESFSRAAAELHVTHGAVSKQIALLEHSLGLKLFARTPSGIVPTAACRSYQQEVASAFERIAAATAALARVGRSEQIHINAPPTFTIRWLVPRLSRFQIRNPSLEIQLSTLRSEVSTALRTADLVIRRGPANWRGVDSELFLRESITPVCSPTLTRGKRLKSPADLSREVWLYADARPDDWRIWLKDAGAAGLAPARALHFDHSSLALEAAIDGLGVAMGPLSMVRGELEMGTLIAPFPTRIAATPGYYAICARRRTSDLRISEIRRWLLAEGQSHAKSSRQRSTALPGSTG